MASGQPSPADVPVTLLVQPKSPFASKTNWAAIFIFAQGAVAILSQYHFLELFGIHPDLYATITGVIAMLGSLYIFYDRTFNTAEPTTLNPLVKDAQEAV